MKERETDSNEAMRMEHVSRRVQNGVEILERETMRTIRLDGESPVEVPKSKTPRLVVCDALSRSRLFVTRSRSQLGDLDSLIRSAVRRPVEAKR